MSSPLTPRNAESVMRQLDAELAGGAISRARFRQSVADLVRERLACSAVTIWAVDDLLQPQSLRCVASSGVPMGPLCANITLDAVPDLMGELARQNIYQTRDMTPNASAAQMQAQQLFADSARALLVNGGMLNARLIGLICAAEHGGSRTWSGAEQGALKRLTAMAVACISRLQSTTDMQYEPV